MTTLLTEGDALFVRCDECRRLWPTSRQHLQDGRWTHDDDADVHRCPLCSEQLGPIGAD